MPTDYGFGAGAGVGSGYTTPNITTPTYTAPQTQPKNSSTASNALSALQLLYGMYKDNQPPKFANQPLSPEQKQLYELYYKSLMNPALKDNAAKVSGMGADILAGYKNLSWQSPATFSGQKGYSGSSTPFQYAPSQAAPSGPPPAVGRGGGLTGGARDAGGGIQYKDPVDSGAGLDENFRTAYDEITRNPHRGPTDLDADMAGGSPGGPPPGMEYDPNGKNALTAIGKIVSYAQRYGGPIAGIVLKILTGDLAGLTKDAIAMGNKVIQEARSYGSGTIGAGAGVGGKP